MGLGSKIAKNTVIHATGRLLSTLMALAVMAIMTRSLGPEGFGGYSTIIAFLQFFGITVDFGLTLTANRLLGTISRKDESDKLMSNLMTLRFISAVVFLGIAPIVALLFPYPMIVKQGMFLTSLSFIAIIMGQTLVPVFQKELRMWYVALSEIFGRVVLLIGVLIVSLYKLDLLWFMGMIVLGSLAQYLFIRLSVIKFVTLRWSFDLDVIGKIIQTSWPIGVSIIFNLIYLKADTIILSLIRSQSEVGFYGASYRVIDQFTALATMFIGLILPPLTAAWVANNKERFNKIYQGAFNAYSLIAFPLLAGALLVGKPVMQLIAGKDFGISGTILGIHMIAMAGVFFSTLFGHIVVVINKQKSMIWGYLSVAVISVIAYLIFIPRYGMFGAAWSTVGTEILITIITFIVVWKTTKFIPNLSMFWKSIFASLAMSVVLYFMLGYHIVLLALLGALVYLLTLYLIGGLKKSSLSL